MFTINRRICRVMQRRRPHYVFALSALGILLLISLLVAGCRPGNTHAPLSPAERDANLRRIAADYEQDGDLNEARANLDKLQLANPVQLLVTLAEQDINEGRSQAEIVPLAHLAEALGGRSPRLVAYLAPSVTPVPPSPTPLPTATSVPASPTSPPMDTPLPPTSTPTAVLPTITPTATSQPRVVADKEVNVRGGPGVNYSLIGQLRAGQELNIVGRTSGSDWWQIAWEDQNQAWVAGTVVRVLGPIDTVPVAKDIPTPPPTPTPAPPTATPKPVGPDFRLIAKRLWGVEENGGWFDGPSVHCGEKRQLRVIVLDARGVALNGVTVKAVYGNKEEEVTGSKGSGIAEFVLGGGQDVFIIRDVDGRQPTSDYARGMSTDPAAIPVETLMGAGFCKNAEDCAHFVSQRGCRGHYSWDVTFQRAY